VPATAPLTLAKQIAYSVPLTVAQHNTHGVQPGDFVHVLGDAHVYNNHIDALELQLLNEPRAFPTLRIKRQALRSPPPVHRATNTHTNE